MVECDDCDCCGGDCCFIVVVGVFVGVGCGDCVVDCGFVVCGGLVVGCGGVGI